jgi:hypothetical protein
LGAGNGALPVGKGIETTVEGVNQVRIEVLPPFLVLFGTVVVVE